MKPANMEELSEVITAAEFHPTDCNIFAYSSSKGIVRICDMRQQALCDRHAKCKFIDGLQLLKSIRIIAAATKTSYAVND